MRYIYIYLTVKKELKTNEIYKDKLIESEICSLKSEITRKKEELFMIKFDYEKLVIQVFKLLKIIVAK